MSFRLVSIYAHINVNRLKSVRIIFPPRVVQDRIAQVMQEAYCNRQEKLEQARLLCEELGEFVLGKLGVNLTLIQSKKNDLVSISRLKGGRFDFEAVVTIWDVSNSLSEQQSIFLSEVVYKVNERVTPVNKFPDKNVNYIGLANIESNTGELADFQPVKGSEILSSSPKFQKGDILYGRMRPYLNKVWVAEFDGVCSGEALVFRADDSKVDVRFLHALLLSQIALDQIIPLQSGSSLPRVSASDVLSVKLPIPKDLNRQKELGNEIEKRRNEARQLKSDAEQVVSEAKARVERMILGEEVIGDDG